MPPAEEAEQRIVAAEQALAVEQLPEALHLSELL